MFLSNIYSFSIVQRILQLSSAAPRFTQTKLENHMQIVEINYYNKQIKKYIITIFV